MDSKRAFLFLLAAITSVLATVALLERPGELDQVPMSNVPTSDPMGKHVGSTGVANPEEFTMHNGSRLITEPVALEDCQTIVERVKSHNGSFNVLSDTCVIWLEGSCEAGYCANKKGVVGAKGLNQTFQWVGGQLDRLLRYCVVTGQDGLEGDSAYRHLVGRYGFWRLYLGDRQHWPRGNDWPNSTGSGYLKVRVGTEPQDSTQ
ncbi:hypothetical protein PG984_003180 [Apiospora sp. TS-2023a]